MTLPQTNPEKPAPAKTDAEEAKPKKFDRYIWQGKIGPAFWTIASLFSITVNIILIIILLVVGRHLFAIKSVVSNHLVDGLYTNFVEMDQAHIINTIIVSDTIVVQDTIPVVFDLPLEQDTQVVLTKDTPVKNATVYLNGQPVPTDIVLKKGTKLNIALDLVVPVNQMLPVTLNVPVQLEVPVDIPLDQTELHQPFTGLQEVVFPLKGMMDELPDSWNETPLCGPLTGWWCRLFLGAE